MQRSQELFAKLDVNGDNSIDSSELKAFTDFVSEKTGSTLDSSALMTALDSDGDGSISAGEFKAGMQKGPHGPPPPRDGGSRSEGEAGIGRLIASLLEQYGSSTATTATSSASLSIAA